MSGASEIPTLQTREDIRKFVSNSTATEKQMFMSYIERMSGAIENNVSFLKNFSTAALDAFSSELELHREHEVQCRTQLLTEESLQAYLDGLAALRLRQQEQVAANAKAVKEAAEKQKQKST